MASKLSKLKEAKQGRGSSKFYAETQEYIKDRGYSDVFEVETEQTRKAYQINSVKEIIEFKEKNGNLPSQGSKDQTEKKMASKLSGLKAAKQGRGNYKLYAETQDYAKGRGYPDMFEVRKQKTTGSIK